jgi:hypothetical protein
MRMKMGRRRSRGKEELVVRRDFRDLSWLLEKEDMLVLYHHNHTWASKLAATTSARRCLPPIEVA